ncbi:MAG: FAD-dependent oxidoreductase [Hyphomonadaceae bacterium]|nr:FAD-dependent oxidoreductase [Hyphomonadaceae bacterium]
MKIVGIVGAGPAGLSAARMVEETGRARAIVFEKQERVGGKSFSTPRFGVVHDLGTCYSTLAHRDTNRWMREMRIPQRSIGKQAIDGVALRKFVTGGRTGAAVAQATRFAIAWRRQTKDFEMRGDDPAVRAIAAAPIAEWLETHRLPAIGRFMLRGLTNMGYGYLHETPTVQALRWCTPTLLASGSLDQIKAPVGGWQAFWERLSQTLDVRLGQPVIGLKRDGRGVELTTPTGAHRLDALVVAAPLDEVPMERTPAEQQVIEAVTWGSYVTTLAGVTGWYPGDEVVAFEAALTPGAEPGTLLSARPAGKKPKKRDGVRLFVCGQYGAGLAPDALVERLGRDLAARGAHLDHVAVQRIWKYNPTYAQDAIRADLLQTMRAMQGQQDTWYTGAAFSFESVSNIVAHNRALAPRIVAALDG